MDHLGLAGFGGGAHHSLAGLIFQPELRGQGAFAAELEAQGFLGLIQAEVKGLVHLQKASQEMHHVAQALPKAHRGGQDLHHLGQEG
jgi:hypothetical protein